MRRIDWAQLLAPGLTGVDPTDSEHIVHVWTARIDACPYPLADLIGVLDAEERRRAWAFKADADRVRHVVGHAFLRAVLGRHLGQPPSVIAFRHGDHGKPALHGREHGSHVRFNLAHSADLVVCAVARTREVGIDVEWTRRAIEVDQVARRFFAREEIEALGALRGECRQRAFYACWTRKEAYVKARGAGLSMPLDSFHVSIDPDERDCSLTIHGDPEGTAQWSLTSIPVGPHYAGALAVETSGEAIALSQVHIG